MELGATFCTARRPRCDELPGGAVVPVARQGRDRAARAPRRGRALRGLRPLGSRPRDRRAGGRARRSPTRSRRRAWSARWRRSNARDWSSATAAGWDSPPPALVGWPRAYARDFGRYARGRSTSLRPPPANAKNHGGPVGPRPSVHREERLPHRPPRLRARERRCAPGQGRSRGRGAAALVAALGCRAPAAAPAAPVAPGASLASIASSQVQAIVEAAETSAASIEREARDHAAQVERGRRARSAADPRRGDRPLAGPRRQGPRGDVADAPARRRDGVRAGRTRRVAAHRCEPAQRRPLAAVGQHGRAVHGRGRASPPPVAYEPEPAPERVVIVEEVDVVVVEEARRRGRGRRSTWSPRSPTTTSRAPASSR